MSDSRPVDKINFIRAYAKARETGFTKANILSGWRTTGNWPISRRKALTHPEIQEDKPESSPKSSPSKGVHFGSDDTPKTSRHIRDLGRNKTPRTRKRYNIIAKGFESQQLTNAAYEARILSLEEEVARLKRGKKRKAVPNPNAKFMSLGEALAAGESIHEVLSDSEVVEAEHSDSSEEAEEEEIASVIEYRPEEVTPVRITRSGREIKKVRK